MRSRPALRKNAHLFETLAVPVSERPNRGHEQLATTGRLQRSLAASPPLITGNGKPLEMSRQPIVKAAKRPERDIGSIHHGPSNVEEADAFVGVDTHDAAERPARDPDRVHMFSELLADHGVARLETGLGRYSVSKEISLTGLILIRGA